MPLVDDEQLEENHEGMSDAVEVIAAVTLLQELRVVETLVPTEHFRLVFSLVAIVVDEAREELHANNSIHIEEHLKDM